MLYRVCALGAATTSTPSASQAQPHLRVIVVADGGSSCLCRCRRHCRCRCHTLYRRRRRRSIRNCRRHDWHGTAVKGDSSSVGGSTAATVAATGIVAVCTSRNSVLCATVATRVAGAASNVGRSNVTVSFGRFRIPGTVDVFPVTAVAASGRRLQHTAHDTHPRHCNLGSMFKSSMALTQAT